MSEKENNVSHLFTITSSRESWANNYRLDEKQKPLEEYALNYHDEFECPISLEQVLITDTTILTCCRNLISDTILRQLRTNLCPYCGMKRLTAYIYIESPFGEKFLIGYDPMEDTVGMMKDRIMQRIAIVRPFKLRKTRGQRGMLPEEALLNSFNVNNGQSLFVD